MTYANIEGDSLTDFLTRPRLISSYAWSVGTTLDVTFTPWRDFFDKSLVFEKMTGFARFRGNLKITVMINGSQFHVGTAYVSYLPLGNDNHTTGSNAVHMDVCAAEQTLWCGLGRPTTDNDLRNKTI